MLMRTSFSYLVMIIGLNCPIIASVQAAEASLSGATEMNSALMQESRTRQLHVRTLAASCATCHGTLGNNAQPPAADTSKRVQLAAINPTEFIKAMQAFSAGTRAATVMHHHAKGLTTQEIDDLAEFFSVQTVSKPAKLHPQKLFSDHAN